MAWFDLPLKAVTRQAPDFVDARVLVAATNETHTVPATAKYVVFSSTGDFFARKNAVATVPVDTTDGTASELNPAAWELTGVTTIGLISAATPTITLAFYS